MLVRAAMGVVTGDVVVACVIGSAPATAVWLRPLRAASSIVRSRSRAARPLSWSGAPVSLRAL